MKSSEYGVRRWTNITSWDSVPQVLDVPGLMRLLRISKPTALKYLADGRISAVRMDRGWRIDKDAVKAFLQGKEDVA